MAGMDWRRKFSSPVHTTAIRPLLDLGRTIPPWAAKRIGKSPGVRSVQAMLNAGKKARQGSQPGRLDWVRPDGRNAALETNPPKEPDFAKHRLK